jgi:predicted NBD/HSP70 family sugar kinase
MMKIGIDLGGTKTEIAAFDASGTEVLRRREPTPVNNYSDTLALIERLIAHAEIALGARATIGIGTPGALSPSTGLMRNSNSTCLNQQPLKIDLERVLGREVRLANDANCFALSEAVDGAAAGAASVFGVIIGTGVGGGIVINGKLIDGPNAIAGEWGHNGLPWPTDDERPGDACYCGKRGCIETFLSGPGLARDYARHSGATHSAETIAEQSSHDTRATEALARYEERLSRALALRTFDVQAEAAETPMRVVGRTEGDSLVMSWPAEEFCAPLMMSTRIEPTNWPAASVCWTWVVQ